MLRVINHWIYASIPKLCLRFLRYPLAICCVPRSSQAAFDAKPASPSREQDLFISGSPDGARGMSRDSGETFHGMASVFPDILTKFRSGDREHVAIEAPACHT